MLPPEVLMRTLCLLIVLLVASPAAAVELTLPQGLTFCQPRAEVLARFVDPNELSDDMTDANGDFAGVDGFFRLFFEDDMLVSVRFRFFEDQEDVASVLKELQGMLGEGNDTGRATEWKLGGGKAVSFKGQSEQMYVQFEVPMDRCGEGGMSLEMTDREKADLEAIDDKKDPAFDPYTMSDDPDKPLVENKKKEEEKEKKKEEKEKQKDVKDADIDW